MIRSPRKGRLRGDIRGSLGDRQTERQDTHNLQGGWGRRGQGGGEQKKPSCFNCTFMGLPLQGLGSHHPVLVANLCISKTFVSTNYFWIHPTKGGLISRKHAMNTYWRSSLCFTQGQRRAYFTSTYERISPSRGARHRSRLIQPHEHRCDNPQQNISQPNSAIP